MIFFSFCFGFVLVWMLNDHQKAKNKMKMSSNGLGGWLILSTKKLFSKIDFVLLSVCMFVSFICKHTDVCCLLIDNDYHHHH